MSINADKLWINVFSAIAKDGFNSGSRLRQHVDVVTDVKGKDYRFNVVGTTESVERGSQEPVMPANIDNATPVATLKNRDRWEFLDIFDAARMNLDLARSYGKQIGKAVGRKLDDDVIQALKNTSNAWKPDRAGYTSPSYTTTATGGLDSTDFAAVTEMFMDEDVPEEEEKCVVLPSTAFSVMAGDTKLASMDYLQSPNGRVNTEGARAFREIYGMIPVFLPQKARVANHGKLDANTAYAFSKSSVGLAIGTIERMGVVEWRPDIRSWQIGAETLAGATAIKEPGIIPITLKT